LTGSADSRLVAEFPASNLGIPWWTMSVALVVLIFVGVPLTSWPLAGRILISFVLAVPVVYIVAFLPVRFLLYSDGLRVIARAYTWDLGWSRIKLIAPLPGWAAYFPMRGLPIRLATSAHGVLLIAGQRVRVVVSLRDREGFIKACKTTIRGMREHPAVS
jgi:hypothetical protein